MLLLCHFVDLPKMRVSIVIFTLCVSVCALSNNRSVSIQYRIHNAVKMYLENLKIRGLEHVVVYLSICLSVCLSVI